MVIAIPSWGIALKFARIRLKGVRSGMKAIRRHHRIYLLDPHSPIPADPWWASARKELIEYSYETRGSVRNALLGGLVSNWLEFVFYWKCDAVGRNFLQPTYFSFFGLVNLQRYGAPVANSRLWKKPYRCICESVGPALSEDGHVFLFEGNFTFVEDDRRVRLLDYGSRKTQEIVRNYGALIVERFVAPNPSDN